MGPACIVLPQFLAGLDVEKGRDEENESEEEHQQILHEQHSRMVDDVAQEPGRLRHL
jgi:hypothetical protein